MTARNKNIPALRFKGFDGAWKVKRLGELGSFKNGLNKDSSDFGFGIPFVNLMDVFGKSILEEGNFGLVNASDKDIEAYSLKKGDVLFIRSSVKRSGVGETILVAKDLPNTVYSGFLIRFRDDRNDLGLDFKNYCFSNSPFRKELLSFATSSANTNINQESLAQIKVHLPSLPEQQKIASFLSAIDEKIRQITRRKELLEQYKKGVMQQLFSGKLRFKDEKGKAYAKWEEKRLGDVAKLQGGYAFKSHMFQQDGIPVIRISNISNDHNHMDLSNVVYYDKIPNPANFTIKKGDLILAMSGATTGKSSIYNLPFNAYLNQRVGLFKSKTDKLSYEFLVQFVFSEDFHKQLETVLVAGAQPNVSSSDIESFSFPFPIRAEQQKIASFLSSIDTKIESVTAQIVRTKGYKKGLLQKMFV